MKQINSDKAPAAIGPYSQAIMAEGVAIYVSGQLPIDRKTGKFAGDTIESQTKQSIENVKVILAEAGYTLQDVVKSTVLLKDIKDFAAMNGVYAEYFKGICPARAAFQVAALPMDALVEVEVVAVKK
jgi:2-iminobutanoate/2-iminopropanoate deaminase